MDAIAEAKRITNFEGKRRQMQFIGKLMRKLEPEVLEAVKKALSEEATGSAADNLVLHQAEIWRDRLIADDDAVAQWISQNPGCDTQQLRALIRQARKDAKPDQARRTAAPWPRLPRNLSTGARAARRHSAARP